MFRFSKALDLGKHVGSEVLGHERRRHCKEKSLEKEKENGKERKT